MERHTGMISPRTIYEDDRLFYLQQIQEVMIFRLLLDDKERFTQYVLDVLEQKHGISPDEVIISTDENDLTVSFTPKSPVWLNMGGGCCD